MNLIAIAQAAALLQHHRDAQTVLDGLPAACRPTTRAEGYAVQQALNGLAAVPSPGWKIAATSANGQRHIGVDGPLAGAVPAAGMRALGEAISLAGNHMRVAECEIAFTFGHDLLPQATPRSVDEAWAAVSSVHPAIEVPDSRFAAFERAGAAQLIADNACARDLVLGPALPIEARCLQLASHPVAARCADGRQFQGLGDAVMGGPLLALAWFVNELSGAGIPIRAGQFVTTGTCVLPIPIRPGDRVEADFGWLGTLGVAFGPQY